MSDSFTSLKGFNRISDVDIQSTVQQNVIGFFDWGFLTKGGFTNVKLGVQDINGGDKSVLKPVSDPLYPDGRVWQCFRQNLVWESGLPTSFQPIQISGVYINGTFRRPTDVGYEHYVDYEGGRVIFTTQSFKSNSIVKMEYAYKSVNMANVQVVPLIKELQSYPNDITSSNYISQSGDNYALSREKIQIPVITVEVSPRVTFRGYEIGSSNQWMEMDIILHVLAQDQTDAMKYGMFCAAQKDLTVWMYDLNLMAASGATPLDFRGAKTANPKTYPQLVDLSSNGGYRFNRMYFKDASVVGPNHVGTIYHTAVRFTIETVAIW